MLTQQRIHGCEQRLTEVTAELRVTDPGARYDELLDEQRFLETYLVFLRAGLVPNG